MGFAFAVLRLSPADFWAMTPREIAAVLEALAPPRQATSRAALRRLMRRHPD